MLNITSVVSIDQLPGNIQCHPIKEGKKFLYFTVDVPSMGGERGVHRIRFIPVGVRNDTNVIPSLIKIRYTTE